MRFSKPSPAMVVALIALVFAMTGTGIAARGLITGKQIKDGSITAKDLANGAVTERKVANGAISQKKLGKGAVGASNLAANSVTAAAIAPNAVGSPAIAPNSVLAADLGAGSVSRDALGQGAVTENALADGSVTFPKLLTRQDPSAPTRSSRTRGKRFGYNGATICWNGIIVYNTPCPAVLGEVAGSTEVQHFTSFTGPQNDVESDCSIAFPFWTKSYGSGVLPTVNGQYFNWQNVGLMGGDLSAYGQVTWGNVSRASTTQIITSVKGQINPPGNTVESGMSQEPEKVYYWDENGLMNIEAGSASATVVLPSVKIVVRTNEVFHIVTIACNSKASGRGYPTLTAVMAGLGDFYGG